MPRDVLIFFDALGMRILEAWGLSETSAVATINPPERVKLGSVGCAVEGIKLEIAGDGEILARGPLVFDGYRNHPDQTAEAIDADGWFHTGDLGRLDDDGYLWLVGRKKELIVSAGGKNMSPTNIEDRIKASSAVIGQAAVFGDRRPYVVALLTMDPEGLASFAAERGIDAEPAKSMAMHPAVLEEVGEAIRRANEALSRPEQVKRWKLLANDWMPGTDELTPTMKLRRSSIEEKYAPEIDGLYESTR